MLVLCAKNCVASMSKGEKIDDKFDFFSVLRMSLMPNDKLTQIVNSYIKNMCVDTTVQSSQTTKERNNNQTKQKSPKPKNSMSERKTCTQIT